MDRSLISFFFIFDQCSSNFPVQNDRVVTRDKDFTAVQVWSMRPLGNDHASVLALDNQVSQAPDPPGDLTQDRYAHCVIITQVHQCIFVVDRGEGDHYS